MKKQPILLKNVSVHNLKGVDLQLNTHELIVFTGVSGSGKSSMAFDTIFVEGQRRYIESLSTFARKYLGDISKPDVELVTGLSPTIAIEQKSCGKNPRSTVGTLTEIYDFLRVLYARIATPYCPESGEAVTTESAERILKKVQHLFQGHKLILLAPYAKDKKGEFKEDFALLLKKGFMRARVDGALVDLSEELALDKQLTHTVDIVIDRVVATEENRSRLAEAVTLALEVGQGLLSVYDVDADQETLYSTMAYSHKSGLYYTSLQPQDFSFNSPSGMCPTCLGLGETREFALEKIIDPQKSIAQDCCVIAGHFDTVRYSNIYRNLSTLYRFDLSTPWEKLSERAQHVFLYGTDKKWTHMHFVHPERDQSWTEYVQWRGVLHDARKRYAEATSELYRKKMEQLMHLQACPACRGSRLKPYPAAARLCGKTIHELTQMTTAELLHFFEHLTLEPQEQIIARDLLDEIVKRLYFLVQVGLHYLSLERTAPTLSGGEAQRVRLASQVGSGLVGITYVLDEPSIGLHPRDNHKLIESLKHLRDAGNTVIVVEHDEETIWAADRIVDFGPGPGRLGGTILVNGSHQELLNNPRSLTGQYLSGTASIPLPTERRAPSGFLTILGATHHNLKIEKVSIPLGVMVAVTGVSGSGKSSLITETLYPALANYLHHAEHPVGAHRTIEGLQQLDKVIAIDQSPIGRTPRSNPATYIKLFDEIRTLFSELPESRSRGYLPGRFSFNVKDGACPNCHGIGSIRVDMDFLEDQWVICPNCRNKRFDQETLSIYYKGKNIHDVLEMTTAEALEFFAPIPALKRKLQLLAHVGMDYMTLGQPSTTLSGGEAQRIKLAKELVRPASGRTLYILDEPTTGLHFHDIKALLHVLHELVDRGNTVLVIEHNMDLVKTADWVIDLGPEAGNEGGELVAEGTPEHLAMQHTPTAKALKLALQPPGQRNHTPPSQTSTPYQAIKIHGAAQNNLKHLDLSIPHGQITICTGPSGSGKSSLAFDTVYAEGQRRYIESLSPYARQFVKQMPKPKVAHIEGLLPAISIEQKLSAGNPRSTVGTQTEVYDYLRLLFAQVGIAHCPQSGEVIKRITPEDVVHSLLKRCPEERITLLAPIDPENVSHYQKLGFLRVRLNHTLYEIDEPLPLDRKRKNELALVIDRLTVSDKNRSRLFEAVEKGAAIGQDKVIVMREEGDLFFNLAFSVESTGLSYPEITPHTLSFNHALGMCLDCQGLGYQYGANLVHNSDVMKLSVVGLLRLLWTSEPSFFLTFLKKKGIDLTAPLNKLAPEALQLLFNGSDEVIATKAGFSWKWLGIQPTLAKVGKSAHSEVRTPLIPLLEEIECLSCSGTRLNPLARNVRIHEHSIASFCQLPLTQALAFFNRIPPSKALEEVFKQIGSRLNFLIEVGLGYLSLNRRAPTLSNGETQRIRLARQLGGQLTGVLYVLDEPTTGLHPHDNTKLNDTLLKLKALGNTLLLVEHDPLTLQIADYILDFGPGAGTQGGHLMAQGSLPTILNDPNSLTGAFLSGKRALAQPKTRRTAKSYFRIENATCHNLKNLTLEIPMGVLCGLTGVSGSGKSTLMHEVIKPHIAAQLPRKKPFDKLIVLDQNPVGHTVRADVGSYSDVLPVLRTFYTQLAAARTKGLQPKHFSYNHRKGMCTHCQGLGYKKIEMLFLPAVRVTCEECHGLRLNPVSLTVAYEGLNFGHLLQLTVEQARRQFALLPKACRIFDTLISVGLGYLTLGQEIASLSGGEAGRIKLAKELSKRGTGRTLYLLDEPTTGLHPVDIEKLLDLLQRLVDKGNSVLIVEHNTALLRACDFLIDLGPGGGAAGGHIVAMGTPEELGAHPTSLTGHYL